MKGTWLTFYIFCFFSLNTVGQTNTKIEDAYVDYFKLSRESLYVHLNKTTFLIGEDIWLKCYAYNRRKKQSFKNTSNIYVGIYDSKGKQIKKKLLLAKNGTANGNFLIDTTYTSGVYYIKASTNWMRNFNEDDAFVQKIVILDNNYKQETQKANTYDLQFLPEGGHIVNQTKNTIGYKIIDNNGNGVKAKAILYDSENEEIASFESNNFGLGKFTLWPNINESYTVVFTLLNGEKLKKILPKPKTEGIALTIDNSKANEIIISINTNNATLTKIKQQKFKIAIHKEGDMKTLPFTFENSTRKSLAINKDILFDGVNTITLINENNTPINERLFYNYKTPKFNSIFVSKLNESKDSISLSIYQNTYKSNNLSISILPETSTSYNPNHNIISANLLQPYLKGFIETPSYYFSNITSKKKEDLDLLLLTQGWSRYNWNSVINYKAEANYNFEQGIKLKGSVISNFTEVDSLYLYSTVYYPAQFVTLDKDKKFTINNFYVLENETLKFSYVNKRMKFLKPNLHITYNVFDEIDSLNKGILEAHQIHIPITTNEHLNRFKNDTISLNEILLSSKKKLVDKIEPFNFSFKNNTKVFDEKAGLTYPDVVSYIRINGYKVSQSFGKVVIQS